MSSGFLSFIKTLVSAFSAESYFMEASFYNYLAFPMQYGKKEKLLIAAFSCCIAWDRQTEAANC
jgi:hypothetical protein